MKSKKQPGRVKSALLNWLGVPISLTTGTFWQEWMGTSSSGKTVTVDKAIMLSAVWACARLLSESVSTLPLKVYKREKDGSRELATDHPAYKVLCKQPNGEMTPSRFMLMLVASICMRGNAFIEKLMIGQKLVGLNPLLPQNMVVKRLDNGQLQYTYTDKNGQRVIPVKNMMHIRGFGLDGVCGMMPMMAGRDVIGSAMAVEESAAKIFENGIQNSGFISAKTDINKEQRERLKQNLSSFVGSKNAGKVMVLEGDMTYQGVTMNPEAAQMLESRSFSIEEICRWFRMTELDKKYKATAVAEADWMSGASKGYNNWLEEVSNVSGTVSDGVKNTLDSAFTNVTSMLEGNKVSWKSWGVSILQIIEKVALQMAVVSAMGGGSSSSSGLFGSLVGGVASYFGGSGTSGAAASSSFSSGAYSNLSFNAKGGVYDSPSLNSFSGGVYNTPTMFAFAQGAGVFGEAGPEAIMPLTRAADGSLGVRAVGGGNSSGVSGGAPQVYISIDGNGNSSSKSSDGWEQFGTQIANYVKQLYQQEKAKDLRPGGDIWNAMKSR